MKTWDGGAPGEVANDAETFGVIRYSYEHFTVNYLEFFWGCLSLKFRYFFGPTRSSTFPIYRTSYVEQSVYFTWCFALNIFDIITEELRWIYSTFCRGVSLSMYSIGRLFFPFSRPLSVNLLDNFVLASAGRIYWIFLSGARRLTYLTFFLVCLLDTSSGRLSASLRGVF